MYYAITVPNNLPSACVNSNTESAESQRETARNLTNLLNLLATAERFADSDTKARLLVGLWRGSGLPWDRLQDLFVMAIASSEVRL